MVARIRAARTCEKKNVKTSLVQGRLALAMTHDLGVGLANVDQVDSCIEKRGCRISDKLCGFSRTIGERRDEMRYGDFWR